MKQRKCIASKLKLLATFFFLFAFTLSFEVNAQRPNKLISENYKVYSPDGSGPFPVVIIIPGCSGVSLKGPKTDTGRPGNEDDKLFRRHWPIMADRLQGGGYLVLIIDYLASENLINTCNGEIPLERVREYITESILLAKTINKADTTRINIIGASYGGAASLAWLANLADNPSGVRDVIAIYPGCRTTQNWNSSLPVLMLLGEDDDIASPDSCKALVKSLPQGINVRVKIYPNARHGFDLTEGPSVLPIGNGKTVGRNDQAGNEAWKEIISFLNEKN